MSRIFASFAAAVAVAAVAAAPASARTMGLSSYSVSGIETGIPQSVGGDESASPFAGAAFSWTAGLAKWTASVTHHALDSSTCTSGGLDCITDGAFSLSGRRSGTITGTFTNGSITLVSPGSGSCSNETYHVVGHVSTSSGPGTFDVDLTHYQAQIPLVGCVTYFATVTGTFGP